MLQFLLSTLHWLLLVVGSIVLFKGLAALVTFWRVLRTPLDASWAARYGKGSWAVVTGCTEGIGKAFCFKLAALGLNLVLISRNEAKLEALNKALWEKVPSMNSIVVQADFGEYNRSLYDNILKKISHLDIALLINNVGIAHIKKFDHLTTRQIEEQININVCSMAHLTQKIVPLMLERKQKCGIVNLSSQSISFSLRTLSVYTGTKAFNDNFSRCLAQDYSGVIDVLDCVPAIVSTAGTHYTSDPFSCTAEQCASWTLKALGKTDYTAGHWTHTLQSWTTSILGAAISRWFANLKLGDVQGIKQKSS